jgi:hypothetical protein
MSSWLVAAKAIGIWLLLAAVLLLALVLFRECSSRRAAEDQLAKEREAAAIDRAGLERIHDVEKAALAKELKAARGESADFRAELARAQAALAGAKVTSVVRASTGPRPVSTTPPETPSNGLASAECLPAGPDCALTEADQGEIRVTEATVETKAGNRVLVGAAEARRVRDDRVLFGGPFSVPVTEASELAPPSPRRPGWGAGPLVGIGTRGAFAGIAVATPEGRMPLLGGQVFGLAQGTGGGGEFAVIVGVVYRP